MRYSLDISLHKFQRSMLITVLVILILSAWTYLLLMTLSTSPEQDLGPGTTFLQALAFDQSNYRLPAFLDICSSLASSLQQPHGFIWTLADFSLILIMWVMMVIAMMLPTILPAFSAFMDLRAQHTSGIMLTWHTVLFILGYFAIWIGFSLVMTGAQALASKTGMITTGFYIQHPLLAGGVLIAAGLYQLSSLKEFCITQCRNPLMFFMQYWRTDLKGSLFIGMRHGLFCLGCCLGLMLVMFCVGLMNIVWMLGIGILMLAEKTLPEGLFLKKGIAALLILWGVLVIMHEFNIRLALF